MLTPDQRQSLQRRCREIETELEQISDLPDDENYPTEREEELQAELEDIQRKLDPHAAARRIAGGRSPADE